MAIGVLGLVAAPAQAAAARPGVYKTTEPLLAGGWHSLPTALAGVTKTAPRGVYYGGGTSEGEPLAIQLAKSGGKLARITEEWTASCSSGMTFPFTDSSPAPIRITSSGKFAATRLITGSSGPDTITITEKTNGTVRGKRISGSSTVGVAVSDPAGTLRDTCVTTPRFTLTSAKGREYAGATSQKAPVVVELRRNGKRVSHFRVGWHGTCTPSGSPQFGEDLTNFPLVSGRFGDSFTSRFNQPTGEFETQDYTVGGKVKKTKASGSFHTKLSFFAASGAPTGSCDSGSISWRATSG